MPLPARHGRTALRRTPMRRPGDSQAHLAFVRSLPCVVCGGKAEAHHLNRAVDGKPKGTGRKNEDRWAIPLCPQHHNGQRDSAHGHGDDEAWLASKGIQGRDLAMALWSHTGDPDMGLRIIYRARK